MEETGNPMEKRMQTELPTPPPAETQDISGAALRHAAQITTDTVKGRTCAGVVAGVSVAMVAIGSVRGELLTVGPAEQALRLFLS